MHTFLKRNLNGVVFAALLCAQLAMVGGQTRVAEGESRLRRWSRLLMLPVQHSAAAARATVAGTWERFAGLRAVEEENRRLQADATRLGLENQLLRRRLQQLESGRSLEAYLSGLESEALRAQVVAAVPNRSAKEVFLNRGRSHGVRAGMAVVAAEGVVGKVTAAYPWSSLVLLVTDSEAGAGVVLARSGAAAVLRGAGRADCRIDHVPSDVPVSVGEFVYMSGTDGVFPRGLPVGRVSRIIERPEERAIEMRPLASLERLSEVAVLLHPSHESLPKGIRPWVALGGQRDSASALPPGLPVASQPTVADRLKLAYQRTAESQGTAVGVLTYSSRPPDFSRVAESGWARDAVRFEGGGLER